MLFPIAFSLSFRKTILLPLRSMLEKSSMPDNPETIMPLELNTIIVPTRLKLSTMTPAVLTFKISSMELLSSSEMFFGTNAKSLNTFT